MITLYDHPRSGNCYKVRLFLSLIGQPCRREFIDVLARKNQTEEFERVSAFRQVPAIEEDGLAIWDSHAILLYLAQKYAPQWLAPLADCGQMYAWISVSTNEIANSLQPLRLTRVVSNAEAAHHLGVSEELLDLEGLQRRTTRVLGLMDGRLTGRDWLAGGPTVADIDCYGYLSLAEEAGIDMAAYPALAAWRRRIEQLPGYVPPGQDA
ncbi:glutathione S-transferase family protein [Bordetella trematum]|uniref:glutathione S-transferase family protein n=1 Tax=Bordetella trematum TaxID=123899 RepID=UPI000D83F52C|nr:glutathione S-transferase family protein [Bordetella trematum]SPU51554.1 glutathione S-transferase [Bordetella trematum]VDH08520.1 GST-like protein yfcG [Bordetella trematum]